jgi:hypothetical protein
MQARHAVMAWVSTRSGRAVFLALVAFAAVTGANGLIDLGGSLHDATCSRH